MDKETASPDLLSLGCPTQRLMASALWFTVAWGWSDSTLF